MAPNEKVLEELYELLTLYFEISPHGGLVKGFEKTRLVEPALDHILLKEKLLTKITALIMTLISYEDIGGKKHENAL